ncbi:MAG: PaaI family thioesterase [Parvularculaceae bacterium]|nr:PaaI family thioesterase [Parvularculaceae bacterium]
MIAPSPIAEWLGFSVVEDDAGRLYRLAFNETHIGNPAIRALHGGVIAAFLELAMQSEIRAAGARPAATVNTSIDFLSSSRAEDMTARVKILRQGRRLAFLDAEGRQSDGTRLVAVARACLKLD